MPPNVKENVATVETLATINVSDLVDPKALALSQASVAGIANDRSSPSEHAADNYWQWDTPLELVNEENKIPKSDTCIAPTVNARVTVIRESKQQREERNRECLSSKHIQRNLEKFQSKEQTQFVPAIQSDHFWDWRGQEEADHVHSPENPSHDYWDWNTDPSTHKVEPKTASDLYWSW